MAAPPVHDVVGDASTDVVAVYVVEHVGAVVTTEDVSPFTKPEYDGDTDGTGSP